MEVGIEDCLHIEFEYDRARYHLRDVVVGKIYFLLVSCDDVEFVVGATFHDTGWVSLVLVPHYGYVHTVQGLPHGSRRGWGGGLEAPGIYVHGVGRRRNSGLGFDKVRRARLSRQLTHPHHYRPSSTPSPSCFLVFYVCQGQGRDDPALAPRNTHMLPCMPLSCVVPSLPSLPLLTLAHIHECVQATDTFNKGFGAVAWTAPTTSGSLYTLFTWTLNPRF